jgi:S1-C subfamily serine protease
VLVDLVTPGSQAEDMGLKAGDVIEQVGDMPTTAPEDVMSQLAHGDAASGDLVALLVRGKSATRWIPLYVGHVDVTDLVAARGLPNTPVVARDAAVGAR